ncbi:hypothetical protein BDQ17DRAFT_1437147 [Cyathus striatus]|nr:hypothetical protein BDQ17DRAFT_1437147 [Cyathus striatus]
MLPITDLVVGPMEVTPGGTISVTWGVPQHITVNTRVLTISPTPADFMAYTVTIPQESTLEIQVPFNATPGNATFEVVESTTAALGTYTGFINSKITRFTHNFTPNSFSPSVSDVAGSHFSGEDSSTSTTNGTTRLGIPLSTVSSTISLTTAASPSASRGSTASIPVGVIVGGVFGAIAGISIISLAIWFIRNRKSGSVTIQKYNASHFNREPTAANDTILEPFYLRPDMEYYTTSTPISSATGYPGIHSNPSGAVVENQRDLSDEPSMVEPPPPNRIWGSYYVSSSTPRRELDAGPIGLESLSEREMTLPPNYSDIFAGSRSSRETIFFCLPLPTKSHNLMSLLTHTSLLEVWNWFRWVISISSFECKNIYC